MTLVNNSWEVLNKENLLDDTVGNSAMNICRDFQSNKLTEDEMYMALEKAEKLVKNHFASSQFKITSNPEQWIMIDTDLYQNVNVKNVFSNDGGKSYYFQNDPSAVFEAEAV